MTKPQDKMRAEFEASYRARHDSRLYCESEWRGWQAACAQQSAQSQQDALDAARWNCAMDWKNQKEFAVCKREGMHWTPINTSVPLDHHIAAQGASNV